MDRGITFSRTNKIDPLMAYCNSDWAGDLVKQQSMLGFVFIFGNGPILWKSSIQKMQALSSCEAEYILAAHCAKQAIWVRQLLDERGFSQVGATTIRYDN